ncbi:MAG: hypothetical protein JXQ90_07670 [Cyclobacteriaceae bacterium]
MRHLTKLILLLFMGVCFNANAQFDIGSLLEAGTADGSTYLENYLTPAFEGFGYAMNGGWYNTAEPHKLGGFDITLTTSFAFVPKKREFWTFNNSDFSNIQLTEGVSAEVPSILGPNINPDRLAELRLTNNEGDELIRLSPLTGSGLNESGYPLIKSNAIPAPMLQAGIGLIKETEIKLRVVPKLDIANGSVQLGMFGIGVLHDLTQWTPELFAIPVDISLFAAYSGMNTTVVIDEQTNQLAKLGVKGTSIQLIASKNILLFTFYSGLGFSTSSTNFDILGRFNFSDDGFVDDPININVGGATPRINLGARFKYSGLAIHAEYVQQKFPLLTFGIGINYR